MAIAIDVFRVLEEALLQAGVMFILILVGFFLRKLNYVTHEATLPFNSLLIHVALPCPNR